MEPSIHDIKQKLAQLQAQHDAGALATALYEEGKNSLERQLLRLVLSDSNPPVRVVEASSRPSGVLLAALAAGVVVLALAGYAWKGAPVVALQGVLQSPGADVAEDGDAHTTGPDQILAMTRKLAERLEEKPDDADGWVMLARSYSVLGKQSESLRAYEKAVALRPEDASLLADYADVLAVANDSSLDGKPMELLAKALALDPANLKALALAGTQAFEKKDYRRAVQYWEKLVQSGAPDHPLVQQIQPGLAEVRKLAGLPAASNGKPAASAVAAVSGTVSLAPDLRARVQPEDTVFVFARAAAGSRVPLAIVRKQVKDLPIAFMLDDSMAMTSSNALSGAGQVVVEARVSKSGNAMPQPGDLWGQTGAVTVGATGLQLEIRETIKP